VKLLNSNYTSLIKNHH